MALVQMDERVLGLENSQQIRDQATPHPGVSASLPYFVSPGCHLRVSQSFDLKSVASVSSLLPGVYHWRKASLLGILRPEEKHIPCPVVWVGSGLAGS